jgi:hypothetical protein
MKLAVELRRTRTPMTLDMKILKGEHFLSKNETRCQSGFQKMVGMTGLPAGGRAVLGDPKEGGLNKISKALRAFFAFADFVGRPACTIFELIHS